MKRSIAEPPAETVEKCTDGGRAQETLFGVRFDGDRALVSIRNAPSSHGDAVCYVRDGRVWGSFWATPSQVNGPY
jgi:hypothetical protein